MSIDQIAAEALRLSAKQRALLAESLWESLGDPHEVSAADEEAATLALAQERDRQIESDQVQPLSHDELMARLRR
jgi:putative addiction module component (TIGR02574 family)